MIGLNVDGKLNKDVLVDLVSQIGGKLFIMDMLDDLLQILSEIFVDYVKLNVVKLFFIIGSGNFQEVMVNVLNDSVFEVNILIMFFKQVEIELIDFLGKVVDLNLDVVKFLIFKSYLLVKLFKFQEGDWKFWVKGVLKDSIDINLLFNYDLQFVVDLIKIKFYMKGDKVDLIVKLENGGQLFQDNDLYVDMKVMLVVNDLDMNKSEE